MEGINLRPPDATPIAARSPHEHAHSQADAYPKRHISFAPAYIRALRFLFLQPAARPSIIVSYRQSTSNLSQHGLACSRADQASSFRIGMRLSNLSEHGLRLPVFCERMTATALACIDGTGSLCCCAHGVARTAAFPPLTPRECNCLGQGSLPGAAPASEAAMKMLVLVLCHEGFVKPAEAATADKVGGVVFFVESAGYNRKRVQILCGVLFFSRAHSSLTRRDAFANGVYSAMIFGQKK